MDSDHLQDLIAFIHVDPLVVGDGLVTSASRTPFKLRCPACIFDCVTPTAPHSSLADTSPLLQ